MKTRTVVSAVAVLSAGALLITGCSSSSSTPTTKSNVTIMTWETNQTNALIDKALKGFKDPNITVTRIKTPSGDYGTKLSSLTQAKKLPDLFWCGNDTEQQDTNLGILTNWKSEIDKSTVLGPNKFGSSLASFTTTSGAIGGVPSLLNTYGIWYNEDALKAAGLKTPATGWTWDDLYADAKALTNKNGATFGLHFGGLTSTDAPFTASLYSISAGGQPFATNVNAPTKVQADADYTAGVGKLAAAIQAGYVAPPGYDDSNATALFSSGKIPLMEGGQWLAAGFLTDKPTVQYGFAPLPSVKASRYSSIADEVGICTPKYTKSTANTFKVLEYLDSTVFEHVLPQSPVAPPAVTSARPSYFNSLSALPSDITTTVNADLNSKYPTGVRFTPTWSSQVNDLTTADFFPILTGKAPLSSLKDYVSKVNAIIQQNQ
jgi:ABC-type glycerol-3-phosphate transport system substrate-binding protein